jgi:hypothetical protein
MKKTDVRKEPGKEAEVTKSGKSSTGVTTTHYVKYNGRIKTQIQHIVLVTSFVTGQDEACEDRMLEGFTLEPFPDHL